MKMKRKTICLIVTCCICFLGFGVSQVRSQSVTVGGGLDLDFLNVISGGDVRPDGTSSVWEYPIRDSNFITAHVHPKIIVDLNENVSGEVQVCFSHHDGMSLITGFMEYTPFVSQDFGDSPLNIQLGRFLVPFGYFNQISINPVDQKAFSRPLMYVDHEQEDMELHGGPRPIFMGAKTDIGVQAYGSKWVRGGQDQFWYGAYVTNGFFNAESKFEGLSRIDVDWEEEPRPINDNNTNKTFGARAAYSVGDVFTVGGSYMTGKYDPRDTLKTSLYGVDAHLALGDANLRFEFAQNPVEWIDKVGTETSPEDLYNNPVAEYTKRGWYTQFDYGFAKRYEVVALFSTLSGGRKVATNSHTFEKMSRLSLGFNVTPASALKFKFEYQMTFLGDYNATASNVAQYGTGLEDLHRFIISTVLAF